MNTVHIVTGALGFIGRELIKELSTTKNSVWCIELDSVIARYSSDFEVKYPGCKLMNIRQMREMLESTGYKNLVLYHLAYSTLHTIPRDSLESAMHDINELVYLLDSCKNYASVSVRFLSSSAVYGSTGGQSINEDATRVVENPYSYMKCTSEDILEYYSRINSIAVSVFRLFTCYGTNQSKNTFIGRLMQSRSDPGCTVDLYKQGSQVRDFLHVSDIISAITSQRIRSTGFRIYNLCGDEVMTLREFSNIVCANTRSLGEEDPNDIITGSNSRIKAELDWRPLHNVKDLFL